VIVVGYIIMFLTFACLIDIQTEVEDETRVSNCLIIEENYDDNISETRSMLDPDFESDVYGYLRDPDIEFPPKKD